MGDNSEISSKADKRSLNYINFDSREDEQNFLRFSFYEVIVSSAFIVQSTIHQIQIKLFEKF